MGIAFLSIDRERYSTSKLESITEYKFRCSCYRTVL